MSTGTASLGTALGVISVGDLNMFDMFSALFALVSEMPVLFTVLPIKLFRATMGFSFLSNFKKQKDKIGTMITNHHELSVIPGLRNPFSMQSRAFKFCFQSCRTELQLALAFWDSSCPPLIALVPFGC